MTLERVPNIFCYRQQSSTLFWQEALPVRPVAHLVPQPSLPHRSADMCVHVWALLRLLSVLGREQWRPLAWGFPSCLLSMFPSFHHCCMALLTRLLCGSPRVVLTVRVSLLCGLRCGMHRCLLIWLEKVLTPCFILTRLHFSCPVYSCANPTIFFSASSFRQWWRKWWQTPRLVLQRAWQGLPEVGGHGQSLLRNSEGSGSSLGSWFRLALCRQVWLREPPGPQD